MSLILKLIEDEPFAKFAKSGNWSGNEYILFIDEDGFNIAVAQLLLVFARPVDAE